MKRIYASLGMAALGVASIQSVQGQSVDTSKPWSASASLRGFYDDNVNGVPSSASPTKSFGFEVSPTLSFALPMEQTTISGGYTYSYKWYEKAINVFGGTGHDSQTHTFAAQLSHSFSERLTLSVQDSFVVGQEPDILRIGNSADQTLQRIPGDNIRNYGAINLNAQITRQFGIEVGYANALYSYADRTPIVGAGALLNRLENTAHIDARWNLQPETVGIVGYQFSWVDYTGNQPVGFLIVPPFGTLYSDSRNDRSHYGYVGLEHTFRPDLFGSIRGGARFSDYYNSPDKGTQVSPYFQASLSYKYAQESHVDLGVSQDQSATYQFSVLADSITLDSSTTVAYVSLTHRIVPNLFGSVVGTYQHATFNGGALNNETEQFYTAGVNLEYRFNRHVSANVGYNYDKAASDSAGVNTFERNRAYIGATVVY